MAWRSGCYNYYSGRRAPANQWPRRSICHGATFFVAAPTLLRCLCGRPGLLRKRCSRTSARVVASVLLHARSTSLSKDPLAIRRWISVRVSALFAHVVSIFVQKMLWSTKSSRRGDFCCSSAIVAWPGDRWSARPVATPAKLRPSVFGRKLVPLPFPLLIRTFAQAAALALQPVHKTR